MMDQDVQSETGLIGGVEKRDILLLPYDPEWPQIFEQHRRKIQTALGKTALAIDHIGSTSVPGLAAKPIIDMMLVVEYSGDEPSYLPPLEKAGYELRVREPDFEEHRMLRTNDRDVHLHVFSKGSLEVKRHLVFRDRLRDSPTDRQRYEEVKLRLAAKDWPDMNAYAAAKSEVIEGILADMPSVPRRVPR